MTTKKISLTSQIAAVQSAASGKDFPARSAAADLQREHLDAAARTLQWVKSHETAFRTYMSERGSR